MKIQVLTIFPELFGSFLKAPLTARAIANESLELKIIDIKDYASGSFRHIDDSPYGGGAGMILKCQPVLDALHAAESPDSWRILLSPSGKPYDQKHAHELLKKKDLILIAGHYEGFDARIEAEADEWISTGDYILSGGEIPAMTIMDSMIRLLGGTIRAASTEEESFEDGLLEYPQYTKPRIYEGMQVPEVLLSGNHEAIRRWKLKESLRRTLEHRPDLLKDRKLTKEETELMEELQNELSNPRD
ncbi:MAG: tRNA (guanosine(37)-N1)-methyltransferase TrmD [Solobacterium sp.]|jgi:tRNA (guanine37-N1)-methyltransferase|nr:tRNA (guanosine(37)-N1)-methyltransferase TrmD [Solobacterium sp.]